MGSEGRGLRAGITGVDPSCPMLESLTVFSDVSGESLGSWRSELSECLELEM